VALPSLIHFRHGKALEEHPMLLLRTQGAIQPKQNEANVHLHVRLG